MAMNETVILVLALERGGLARRVFLRRPLVDGAQGPFVQTAGALVLGSLLLRMSMPWLDSMLSPAVIGSGCWRVSSDSSSRAFSS
jgi:hypothetical protein